MVPAWSLIGMLLLSAVLQRSRKSFRAPQHKIPSFRRFSRANGGALARNKNEDIEQRVEGRLPSPSQEAQEAKGRLQPKGNSTDTDTDTFTHLQERLKP